MSKVLYIKANAKPEGVSRTFKVSDSFVKSYKESHPNDEVIVLDLYNENIDFLKPEDLAFHAVDPGEGKNHPVLKYAYQFLEADKIIISAPFWNLSFPAILKAYIDYITVSGITFKYTAEGPVGLCNNKKIIHFVTRGGEYSKEPLSAFELGDKYLRTIFGFLGIHDFTTYALENLDVSSTNVDKVIEDAINDVSEKAKLF